VPSLDLVNHASEFALPFPTGEYPSKVTTTTTQVQQRDALGRPIYDDGLGGTTNDLSNTGTPLPPLMGTVTEQQTVSLQDQPTAFSLDEVRSAVENDFVVKYPFYDWCKVHIFDDRLDPVSAYQGLTRASGFASAGHPLFMGQMQISLDLSTNPMGYLMLVAPVIPKVDWFFQIRHGVVVSGQKGPLSDLLQAQRFGEAYQLFPLEVFTITPAVMTDGAGVVTSHFWLRTQAHAAAIIEPPYPVIPWLAFLGKHTAQAT
jgi:hypothetical protein